MTEKIIGKSSRLVMLPFANEKIGEICRAFSHDPFELFLTSSQMPFPVTEGGFQKYVTEAQSSGSHEIFSFIDNTNESLVGHCELKAISPRHRHGTIANVFIMPNHRGEGLGVEMIRMMLRYAFETRKLQRVGLAVHTNNIGAVTTYVKAGFQFEGVIRDVLRFEEKDFSLYQMSVLASEYEPA